MPDSFQSLIALVNRFLPDAQDASSPLKKARKSHQRTLARTILSVNDTFTLS